MVQKQEMAMKIPLHQISFDFFLDLQLILQI